ncbi:MAG: HD domain-containing protein [Gemmatimonadota bacterium]|nr:MAG: HD domain-containing protein [Gemmatimonadota bacterium]
MVEGVDRNSEQNRSVRGEHERKLLAESGRNFINQFFVTYKVAQIYEANNDAFMRQHNVLMATLQRVFEREDKVTLEISMRSLFLNRVKIIAQFLHYGNLTFLLDLFEDLNISSITFSKGLDDRELTAFLYLLARRDRKWMHFEEFQDRLGREKLVHVAVTKLVEQSKEIESAKALARRLFVESINNLKGIMKDIQEGSEANAKRTRRLVQGFIDLMNDHEMYMIGLTTTKNFGSYALNHSLNVCLLSLALGQRLGLERKHLRDLGLAAIFHDLGNLIVPQDILEKPSPLTDEEFQIVKEHPLQGAEMLMEVKGLGTVPVRALRATLEHHIKADMTGYPQLWRQRRPDLFSKIIEIADCFDAATTSRPYRPAPRRPDLILKEMVAKSGSDFDPVLLKVFIEMIGVFPVGSLVTLDTGEIAVVVESNPDPTLLDRPKVKLFTDKEGNSLDGDIVDLSDYDKETNRYVRTVVTPLDAHSYGIDSSRFF